MVGITGKFVGWVGLCVYHSIYMYTCAQLKRAQRAKKKKKRDFQQFISFNYIFIPPMTHLPKPSRAELSQSRGERDREERGTLSTLRTAMVTVPGPYSLFPILFFPISIPFHFPFRFLPFRFPPTYTNAHVRLSHADRFQRKERKE